LIDGTFDAKDICVERKGTGRGGQRRRIRIGKRRHPVVLFLLSQLLQTWWMKQSLSSKGRRLKFVKAGS